MNRVAYEYLFALCIFMLFLTAVLHLTNGLLLRVVESITLIILQITGVVYLIGTYRQSRIKWIGLLIIALSLTFAGTVFDRFISGGMQSHENIIDLFWVASYFLYLYSFYTMVKFVFINITRTNRLIHILLTVLFFVIGFVIAFNWTLDIGILMQPTVVYFIYSVISISLFSMALYAYLGGGMNPLSNVVGIFCLGSLLLVVYSMLDNYSKINGIREIASGAYLLYLLFYVIMLYGMRKMLEVVSNEKEKIFQ